MGRGILYTIGAETGKLCKHQQHHGIRISLPKIPFHAVKLVAWTSAWISPFTILTQMMADEFNVLWSEILGKPQMWERAHVGFGDTARKRKGPCTKQCAWRKHGSSDTRLAEACPPKLRNTVKYRVEEMRPKWPFWKHRAPKMRLVEAQCAHRKHCYPKTPLGSDPTSRVLQNSELRCRGRCRWNSFPRPIRITW